MKNKILIMLFACSLLFSGCGSSQTNTAAEINTETISTETAESASNETESLKSSEVVPSEAAEAADTASSESDSNLDENIESDTDSASSEEDFSAIYSELLTSVLDVQAGSAGCSLRAENAASEVADFIETYKAQIDESQLTDLTSEWLTAKSESDSYIKDELAECMIMISSEIENSNSELASDSSYLTLKTVLDNACQ